MLTSSKVRIRPAIEVGKKAVDYCRGKDFYKWIMDEQQLLRQKVCSLNESGIYTLTQDNNDAALFPSSLFVFVTLLLLFVRMTLPVWPTN